MAVSGSGAFLGSIGLLRVAREHCLKFMGGKRACYCRGSFSYVAITKFFAGAGVGA
jgi:hypothetical protein